MRHMPDTIDGVLDFCESEGQPAESVRRLLEAARAVSYAHHRWTRQGGDPPEREILQLRDVLNSPEPDLQPESGARS